MSDEQRYVHLFQNRRLLAVLASLEALEEWFPDVDDDLIELDEPTI